MTIKVNESLVAMWYLPYSGGDFMAAVQRKDDDKYEFVYRFRYYKDDLTGYDSKDEKHWYEGLLRDDIDSDQKAFDAVSDILEEVRRGAEVMGVIDTLDEITCLRMHDNDVEDFVKRLQEQPWAHTQKVN